MISAILLEAVTDDLLYGGVVLRGYFSHGIVHGISLWAMADFYLTDSFIFSKPAPQEGPTWLLLQTPLLLVGFLPIALSLGA